MTTEEKTQWRRVLVLAGGGAKGAYAFGCLRAFRRCGIHFDAVAGTSVGALNALIWSAKAFKEGRKLWLNLSFRSVYPLRSRWWQRMPKIVAWIGGFVHVIWRLSAASARGTPHEASKVTNALVAAPVGAAAYFCLQAFPPWACWALAVLAAFEMYFTLNERNLGSRMRRLMQLAMVLLPYCSLSLTLLILGEDFAAVSSAIAIGVGLAVLLATAGTIAGVVYVTLRGFDHTFLDNAPLADSIRAILRTRSLHTPVYATSGVEWYAWDPDNPTFSALVTGFDRKPYPGTMFYRDRQRSWLPMYWPVHELSLEDQIRMLLASAALPFGVVPSVDWNGHRLVDGGVVDNVPLYPVSGSAEAFVVLLEPVGKRTLAQLELTETRWTAIDRGYRLLLHPMEPIEVFRIPKPSKTRVIPERTPDSFPIVRVFAPKKSLGNFLTGTLHFSGKYARKRMREGYVDTMKALLELGLLPGTAIKR